MSGISFTGVGSGIDTKTIVNTLVRAEISPLREQLTSRKSSLNAQLSSLGRLKSALNEFQTTLNNLKSPEKFQARSTIVSNENRLTATSRSSAQPGSYEVEVKKLAVSQRLISADGAYQNANSVIGEGTITFGVGGAFDSSVGNGFSVNVGADATLEDIRTAINNAEGNDKLTATIINVDDINGGGSQARLILTANQTGTANAITIGVDSNSSQGLIDLGANFVQSRAADDAVIEVNGLRATRSTNEISDVIEGVTLNLKSAELDDLVNVTVGTDNASIEKNVQSFVDAYNKLQGLLRDLGGSDSSGLRGDSTVRNLSIQLRSITGSEVSGGSSGISILAQVGVSIDKDGKMNLDKTNLNAALTQDFSSVSRLFTSEMGIANRLDGFIKAYSETGGLLDNRTEGVNSRVKSIDRQQERLDFREESLFNRLSRQFNAMDSIVAQINSNGAFLTSQLASLQQR